MCIVCLNCPSYPDVVNLLVKSSRLSLGAIISFLVFSLLSADRKIIYTLLFHRLAVLRCLEVLCEDCIICLVQLLPILEQKWHECVTLNGLWKLHSSYFLRLSYIKQKIFRLSVCYFTYSINDRTTSVGVIALTLDIKLLVIKLLVTKLPTTGSARLINIYRMINTLRPRKMAAIFQTTFWNAFSSMKMYEFWLKFHWSLFLGVQLTIFHHWVG